MCRSQTAAFLPIRPPGHYQGHLIDVWGDLLGLGDLSAAAASPWPVPQMWRDQARRALGGIGVDPDGEYVLIHPGAGSQEKCWPVDKFVQLVGQFGQAAFAIGPVEADRWRPDVLAALGDACPLLACPSLGVLAGALARAKCYVGNDSGVSHLAAAVGRPTVALFGPTRAEPFAPLGRSVKTISSGHIDDIAVNEVLTAVNELLG